MPDTLEMAHLKLYSLKGGPPLDVFLWSVIKMIWKRIVAASIGIGMTGIAAGQVAPGAPTGRQLTFIVPGDNDSNDPGLACGASFGFSYVIDSTKGSRSGVVERTSENSVLVTTFKGADDGSVGKGEKQHFTLVTDNSKDACTLTFSPSGPPEEYKTRSLVNLWKIPDFSPNDVLTDSFKVFYQFSTKAEFPVESVMANFDRLADKGCNHLGYGRSVGFDFTNGVGAPVYCAHVGEKVQPVRIECVPYRNGSMCTASAVLQIQHDGDRYSTLDGAKRLRESITAIVNN